jgi:ABC-type transport system involved in cytochrome c biogenesis ATPase subunit
VRVGGHLVASGVAIERRGLLLVQGLAIEVRPGLPLVITGPNGSGKSTLVRVLARLEPPDRGWVRHHSPGGITWVEPGIRFPPDVGVQAWLRLGRSTGRPVVPGVGFLLPASGHWRGSADRLSTGERKRLILWAALSSPGGLIFLDEPFDHLSSDVTRQLGSLLLRLAGTRGLVLATNRGLPAGFPPTRELRLAPDAAPPCA